MSEVTSFNSFPNDPTSSYFSSSTPSSSDELLSPAFESSDFYDPFSDLSLFLSKKIKGELQKTGSSKKWSGKIESHLLAKILPEFKQKFPNYRLGVAALRKVWEKVSYYYEKIQNQTGALQENGTLDLYFMIRENLKEKGGENPPLNLPPYHFAHQVALKVGECMATFEGVRPDTIHLVKLIWSAQKHLLRGLSSQNAKSPYEDFDPLDKLVVKTQLEVSSEEKGLSYEKL
ncbi:MAG: hypothetical protein HYZ47_05510, partial [Simkania negevensis]|nr:hypothetical protein [Simkania negevensis]